MYIFKTHRLGPTMTLLKILINESLFIQTAVNEKIMCEKQSLLDTAKCSTFLFDQDNWPLGYS